MLATDDSFHSPDFQSPDVIREIEVDGVRFQVIARRLGDGWFGTWHCRYCRRHGVNGVVYQTAQAALDLTIENLAPHSCRAVPREELSPMSAGRFS